MVASVLTHGKTHTTIVTTSIYNLTYWARLWSWQIFRSTQLTSFPDIVDKFILPLVDAKSSRRSICSEIICELFVTLAHTRLNKHSYYANICKSVVIFIHLIYVDLSEVKTSKLVVGWSFIKHFSYGSHRSSIPLKLLIENTLIHKRLLHINYACCVPCKWLVESNGW